MALICFPLPLFSAGRWLSGQGDCCAEIPEAATWDQRTEWRGGQSTGQWRVTNTLLTLKVPEKLQLYGLYVYCLVHICDFGMLRVKAQMSLASIVMVSWFTRNYCACAPMLYISELCEDCAVANEIDYVWASIHDNEHVITACDVWL